MRRQEEILRFPSRLIAEGYLQARKASEVPTCGLSCSIPASLSQPGRHHVDYSEQACDRIPAAPVYLIGKGRVSAGNP